MHEERWMADTLDRLEEMSGQFFRYFHSRIDEVGGLSRSQFFLLFMLQRKGVSSVSTMAEFLGMTAAGATGLIDRLVRQELVVRRRDEHDRRIVWVEISEAGKTQLSEARRLRRAILLEVFGRLSRTEVEQFIHLYEKMVCAIPEP